jgi:hypothetical protein
MAFSSFFGVLQVTGQIPACNGAKSIPPKYIRGM